MSNPAMIPAETALRFINPQSVKVGDLYTVNTLGTNAAKLMRRYPFTTHTVTMRDGAEIVHVTVRPTANDLGQHTYARVVEVRREPVEVEAANDAGPINFAAGLV